MSATHSNASGTTAAATDTGGRVDIPHLLFAGAIAGWCAWFCIDAWSASRNVENLVLIVPAAALAVVLFAFVAVGCFRRRAEGNAGRRPIARSLLARIAGTMALLAVFAAAGPLVGFDVAILAYVALMLLLGGERRPLVLVLVPVLFCAAVVYCFGTVLATPLPTLLPLGT